MTDTPRLTVWSRRTRTRQIVVRLLDRAVNYAAVIVATSSVLLALNYSGQLNGFKSTIYDRCIQRQTYDESNHTSVEADVDLYTEILRLSEQVPLPADPQQRVLAVHYRDAITTALVKKQAAADRGVIGSCAAYR